ncbi:MAG: thioredoxin domain-containing protein [Candidatus Limnocylindrales bacterium]
MVSEDRVHTNRLAHETSPYLLQHAHNPVDWYPWGPEALNRAKDESRPIFLSIGYAACHWCHVMERESFEKEDTARLLNDSFVAIKVDREERPDLDAIYMDAVQQMTGHGGWPMSVFLTPDGKPFYGGTYFPDTARHGLPSFSDVLAGVAEAWRERRTEVEEAGTQIVRTISAQLRATPAGSDPAGSTGAAGWMLDAAVVALEREFDARNGGWGGAPKFPQPMTIEFLLRMHVRSADPRALAMARRTLDAMAGGGIYDHLGGGFARYATDSVWLVPHFEKMLYDNAQLARVYVHAWQATGEPVYRHVAEETLHFVLRELRTGDGGFASSLDADTEGEEGATYVWSKTEVDVVLGEDAAAFDAAYDVTEDGNWEGKTILRRVGSAGGEDARLAAARGTLLAVRHKRPQPARDDKVLTAWNGLMIAAFAEAGAVMNRADWIQTAERVADLVLRELRDADGRLRRAWKDGRALHSGVLEDYANLADGFLALYEATFVERWFVTARQLMDFVIAHFPDPTGGFFDTADDHEALITRPKSLQDNAVPSGNAMAATVLLKLAALTGESRYSDAAERAIAQVTPYAHRYPTSFAQWLNAIAFALGDVTEVAIVGDPASPDARALLGVLRGKYRPFNVVALAGSRRANDSAIALLHDRIKLDGKATAYVCRAFACRAPTNNPVELAAQLATPA